MILRNYAADDPLFRIARIGTGFALIAAYPVTFCGLRESFLTLVTIMCPSLKQLVTSVIVQDLTSMTFVAVVTLCAALLVDEAILVGLVGATCGCAVIFVIPTIIHVFA